MEDYRILYMAEDGILAVIVPSFECLKTRTIQEIADKDVPDGLPYKIVHVSDIPSERDFRAAWEIDQEELTDGIGCPTNEFDEV
jgi:hypothetical protein